MEQACFYEWYEVMNNAGQKYLYRKSSGGLGYRTLGAAETAWPTANTTDTYRLRPVAVVSVTTE